MARPTTTHARVPDARPGTLRRKLLLLTGLSLALSGSTYARFEVSGLLFQPVVLPALILLMVCGPAALRRIPRAVSTTLGAFVLVFVVTSLLAGFSLGELAKVGMFWLVLVAIAIAVDDEEDARAAAVGFALAMGLISVQALALGSSDETGINPFEGVSNENGFSIYALPALLLAGFFLLEKTTPARTKVLLALASMLMLAAIFSTPNRSGFVGVAAVVILLLARGRRARDVIGMVLLGSFLYWGFLTFGDTSALDYELRGPQDKQSDLETRLDYLEAAVDVGLANIVTGVGVQDVPIYLADSFPSRDFPNDRLDPHNLIGYLFAGGGLPLIVAFWALIATLWMRPAEYRSVAPPSEEEKVARGLLRITVLLFLIRGMFTGDVLTTPAFPAALGIALGYTIATRPRVAIRAGSSAGRRRSSVAIEGDDDTARPAPTPGGRPEPRSPAPASWIEAARLSHPRRLIDFDPWSRSSADQ